MGLGATIDRMERLGSSHLVQAGLLWEWNDAIYPDFEGTPITRGMRGGSWSLGLINASKFGPRDYEPTYSDDDTGFRLATNPR